MNFFVKTWSKVGMPFPLHLPSPSLCWHGFWPRSYNATCHLTVPGSGSWVMTVSCHSDPEGQPWLKVAGFLPPTWESWPAAGLRLQPRSIPTVLEIWRLSRLMGIHWLFLSNKKAAGNINTLAYEQSGHLSHQSYFVIITFPWDFLKTKKVEKSYNGKLRILDHTFPGY